MKVSTEIDNNFGYEKITQLVDNIPLSQFFLGNSGPLKRQNEQRTQYFRDYEKSKRSRQFLKPEWKQNRPWLVDTETGMVCSYCKEQKK